MVITEITLETKDLVEVEEVARRVNRSKMTVYRWIKGGKIASVKIGKVLYIPTTELEKMIRK